ARTIRKNDPQGRSARRQQPEQIIGQTQGQELQTSTKGQKDSRPMSSMHHVPYYYGYPTQEQLKTCAAAAMAAAAAGARYGVGPGPSLFTIDSILA
ncbi:hypothetical protein LSAT2_032367, partial [Lamellibrachia satsuma]